MRDARATKKQIRFLEDLARRAGHADVPSARRCMALRCRVDGRRPEARTLLEAEGARLDIRSASALIDLLLSPPALRVELPPGDATSRFASVMDSLALRWTRRDANGADSASEASNQGTRGVPPDLGDTTHM